MDASRHSPPWMSDGPVTSSEQDAKTSAEQTMAKAEPRKRRFLRVIMRPPSPTAYSSNQDAMAVVGRSMVRARRDVFLPARRRDAQVPEVGDRSRPDPERHRAFRARARLDVVDDQRRLL